MRVRSGRSGSVCGHSADLGKREGSAGRILFPCDLDTLEVATTKGLIIRLKPKKTSRVNSVPRQRPINPAYASQAHTPLPLQSRAVIPVFPPKRSRHSPKPSIPTGSHPMYAFPDLRDAGNFGSHQGLLPHRLVETRERVGRSHSPGLGSEIYLGEGPMVVVPLTPVLSSKDSSRLMTEMEDYSNPRLLARYRPTNESRRVVYSRRKPNTDWVALYSSLNCNQSP